MNALKGVQHCFPKIKWLDCCPDLIKLMQGLKWLDCCPDLTNYIARDNKSSFLFSATMVKFRPLLLYILIYKEYCEITLYTKVFSAEHEPQINARNIGT